MSWSNDIHLLKGAISFNVLKVAINKILDYYLNHLTQVVTSLSMLNKQFEQRYLTKKTRCH